MLIIAILAGVLLHTYRADAIASATDRQLQLKAEYLYRTLEISQVENFSLGYLRAIAENLVGIETVVPGDILHREVGRVLDYLRPLNTTVVLTLSHGDTFWIQTSPENGGYGKQMFIFSGKISIVVAEAGENRIVQVPATLTLFER
ncbi:MAG: hypothetical protein QW179_02280 [Candidatus Hadarchaeales archaeon]